MSSHSMKYHNIPSLDLIEAYKSGKLTGEKLIMVERAISLNPMVAGVVEDFDAENVPAIRAVSARVLENFLVPKLMHRGFWSKYVGWIGLSAIILLFGIYEVTEMNKPEPRYSNETMLLTDQEVNPDAEVRLAVKETTNDVVQNEPLSDGDQNVVVNSTDEDAIRSEEDNLTEELEMNSSDKEFAQTADKELNPEEDPKVEKFDNTREFSAENKSNQTILLAVSNVQILSKMNPDAMNTRTTSGGGNPLGDQTTSSSNNFSVSDIPSYPGGDRALNNYFKGKLRPIKVPQHQDKFDRTVLVELTINSRGKLKDYKIRGQLHPTHQDALTKAIEELPRFNKGSEKITYSLGLSF